MKTDNKEARNHGNNQVALLDTRVKNLPPLSLLSSLHLSHTRNASPQPFHENSSSPSLFRYLPAFKIHGAIIWRAFLLSFAGDETKDRASERSFVRSFVASNNIPACNLSEACSDKLRVYGHNFLSPSPGRRGMKRGRGIDPPSTNLRLRDGVRCSDLSVRTLTRGGDIVRPAEVKLAAVSQTLGDINSVRAGVDPTPRCREMGDAA